MLTKQTLWPWGQILGRVKAFAFAIVECRGWEWEQRQREAGSISLSDWHRWRSVRNCSIISTFFFHLKQKRFLSYIWGNNDKHVPTLLQITCKAVHTLMEEMGVVESWPLYHSTFTNAQHFKLVLPVFTVQIFWPNLFNPLFPVNWTGY